MKYNIPNRKIKFKFSFKWKTCLFLQKATTKVYFDIFFNMKNIGTTKNCLHWNLFTLFLSHARDTSFLFWSKQKMSKDHFLGLMSSLLFWNWNHKLLLIFQLKWCHKTDGSICGQILNYYWMFEALWKYYDQQCDHWKWLTSCQIEGPVN